ESAPLGYRNEYIFHGDELTLTEDEANRWNADDLWETPEAAQEREAAAAAATTEEAPSENEQAIADKLQKSNVDEAIAFLSQPGWTADGYEAALTAEEAGKDRKTVTEFIDARLEEMA